MTIQEALEEAQKRFGGKITLSEVTDYGGMWKQPSTRRYTHIWNWTMFRIDFTGDGQTWEETFANLQKEIDRANSEERGALDVSL